MLLLFTAENCYACSKLKGFLDLKGTEYRSVDVDSNCAMAAEYCVRALPTLVCVDDNLHEKWRVVGFSTKELNKKLKEVK
ncbi:MAG: Glutaredoxin [Bacteroidota bacterium]|jgi:thioredoxin-related protein